MSEAHRVEMVLRQRSALLFFHMMAVAAIGAINVAVDPELQFSIFYLAPIINGAYRGGRTVGLLTALAASVAWSVNSEYGPALAPSVFVAVWNSLSRTAVYLTLALIVDAFAREHRRAIGLASTDELTALPNARAFRARLTEELARARRTDRPLAVLYVDSDHLKVVNDRFGHRAGDKLLIALAAALRAHRRTSDLVARVGGDEFAVVLPETDTQSAMAVAERIRASVSATGSIVRSGASIETSVSIGVAVTRGELDESELLRRGDEALYDAKRGGRDRVALWSMSIGERPDRAKK